MILCLLDNKHVEEEYDNTPVGRCNESDKLLKSQVRALQIVTSEERQIETSERNGTSEQKTSG